MASIALKWTGASDMWFAHTSYGHWTIELNRRDYVITLKFNGVHEYQDMGIYSTLARAKAGVNRDHRILIKQVGA